MIPVQDSKGDKSQKAEIPECDGFRTWLDDWNLEELCRYLFQGVLAALENNDS